MCLHDSYDPYFWTEENTGVKHRPLREGTYGRVLTEWQWSLFGDSKNVENYITNSVTICVFRIALFKLIN